MNTFLSSLLWLVYRTVPLPWKTPSCSQPHLRPSPTSALRDLVSVTIVLSFWDCDVNEIMQHRTFQRGISRYNAFEFYPCFPFCSFLLLNRFPSYGCTAFVYHSSVESNLDCFRLDVVMSKVAINIYVQVFTWA